MGKKTYTTKEIADRAGIHVNTVRFYETVGFLTSPARARNGYRIFTQLQLDQCALIRRAMNAQVLQNGLRKRAAEIVRLCAALRFEEARAAVEEYCRRIDTELRNAADAAAAAEDALRRREPAGEAVRLGRAAAAERLGITVETLRTWERSGLLTGNRGESGRRVYDAEDLKRLRVIRTLRCANYSLTAILRLLNGLERNAAVSVEAALNRPDEQEELLSACDRLIGSLANAKADALALLPMIAEMRRRV